MPNTPLMGAWFSAILRACSYGVKPSRPAGSVTVIGTCAGRCAPRVVRVSRSSPRSANSTRRSCPVCAGAGRICPPCCVARLRPPGRSPRLCPASAPRTMRRATPAMSRVGCPPICAPCGWNAAATSASVTSPSRFGTGSNSMSCSAGFCPRGASRWAGRIPPRCSPSRGFARNAPNSAWPSTGMTPPRSTICSASTPGWSTTTGFTARSISSANTRTPCAAT